MPLTDRYVIIKRTLKSVFTMRELISILKDFGFSKKEAEVYFAILELGEVKISDIARKAKLPRTSCYEIIEDLMSRHMVSYFVRKRTRLYVAEEPRKLALLFEHHSEVFRQVLPRLEAMARKAGARPVIRFYEGRDGLKNILDEVIGEQRNFDAITSIDDARILLGGDFEDFAENRKKRYLHVRLLTIRSKQSEALKDADSKELRETRFVPEEYRFKTANWIFGDKVALLSLQEEHPIGIIIHDASLAGTFRMYFELLWSNAERR